MRRSWRIEQKSEGTTLIFTHCIRLIIRQNHKKISHKWIKQLQRKLHEINFVFYDNAANHHHLNQLDFLIVHTLDSPFVNFYTQIQLEILIPWNIAQCVCGRWCRLREHWLSFFSNDVSRKGLVNFSLMNFIYDSVKDFQEINTRVR